MVTAELAACLPVLVLVLAVALAAVSVVGEQVRAQDAAGEVVRAAVRGDRPAEARLFAQTAPGRSSFAVSSSGQQITVVVRAKVRPLGGWLGTYSIVQRAVGTLEPAPATVPP